MHKKMTILLFGFVCLLCCASISCEPDRDKGHIIKYVHNMSVSCVFDPAHPDRFYQLDVWSVSPNGKGIYGAGFGFIVTARDSAGAPCSVPGMKSKLDEQAVMTMVMGLYLLV